MSEWWEKPGRLDELKQRFKPDGLLRLARSTPEYYDSHGHYLPGVSVLALHYSEREQELTNALREVGVLLALLGTWFTEAKPDVPAELERGVVGAVERVVAILGERAGAK